MDGKNEYTVGVRAVHVRHYGVAASSEAEAVALVRERGEGVRDLDFEEYSHELDPETWSVEAAESPAKKAQASAAAEASLPRRFVHTQEGRHALAEMRARLAGRTVSDASFTAEAEGLRTHLHLDNGDRYSFRERELSAAALRGLFPEVFARLAGPCVLPAAALRSSRAYAAAAGERLVRAFASLEGFADYDAALDREGFAPAALGALRAWCAGQGRDWAAALAAAETEACGPELVEDFPGACGTEPEA